ncbi:dephospho-CoA kinase [Riemerella columbina]|uniref:dephospho-CoA kinase n=1 Tax=Riemerella columbina TaxID=103810 RepID=UPI00266EEA7D|nr:dephospho-CoA kinase [Riemerella columbina]WKS95718.1 dephospho-CoA kinase [Riemerella columbina]
MKKQIGITGGIGSGKTTVAEWIEQMGYPVYNSDSRAKILVNTDPQLKAKIIALLGENAYDEQGNYNRKWVATQVFEDTAQLEKLNQLIHPAVRENFEAWVAQQTAPFIFKETALLFELGLDRFCDKTILVTAEQSLRIKRVMDRDNKTYREVEAIILQQMPEAEKINRADFVIYNNGSLEDLHTETEATIQDLVQDLEGIG